MSKNVAVVYWTGTGNTEAMANAVAEGAAAAGAEARAVSVADFSPTTWPALTRWPLAARPWAPRSWSPTGSGPVWEACKPALAGRPVALFGSYGWGGGEWMDTWKEDAEGAGLAVVDALIANEAPGDEAVEACQALGRLAEA